MRRHRHREFRKNHPVIYQLTQELYEFRETHPSAGTWPQSPLGTPSKLESPITLDYFRIRSNPNPNPWLITAPPVTPTRCTNTSSHLTQPISAPNPSLEESSPGRTYQLDYENGYFSSTESSPESAKSAVQSPSTPKLSLEESSPGRTYQLDYENGYFSSTESSPQSVRSGVQSPLTTGLPIAGSQAETSSPARTTGIDHHTHASRIDNSPTSQLDTVLSPIVDNNSEQSADRSPGRTFTVPYTPSNEDSYEEISTSSIPQRQTTITFPQNPDFSNKPIHSRVLFHKNLEPVMIGKTPADVDPDAMSYIMDDALSPTRNHESKPEDDPNAPGYSEEEIRYDIVWAPTEVADDVAEENARYAAMSVPVAINESGILRGSRAARQAVLQDLARTPADPKTPPPIAHGMPRPYLAPTVSSPDETSPLTAPTTAAVAATNPSAAETETIFATTTPSAAAASPPVAVANTPPLAANSPVTTVDVPATITASPAEAATPSLSAAETPTPISASTIRTTISRSDEAHFYAAVDRAETAVGHRARAIARQRAHLESSLRRFEIRRARNPVYDRVLRADQERQRAHEEAADYERPWESIPETARRLLLFFREHTNKIFSYTPEQLAEYKSLRAADNAARFPELIQETEVEDHALTPEPTAQNNAENAEMDSMDAANLQLNADLQFYSNNPGTASATSSEEDHDSSSASSDEDHDQNDDITQHRSTVADSSSSGGPGSISQQSEVRTDPDLATIVAPSRSSGQVDPSISDTDIAMSDSQPSAHAPEYNSQIDLGLTTIVASSGGSGQENSSISRNDTAPSSSQSSANLPQHNPRTDPGLPIIAAPSRSSGQEDLLISESSVEHTNIQDNQNPSRVEAANGWDLGDTTPSRISSVSKTTRDNAVAPPSTPAALTEPMQDMTLGDVSARRRLARKSASELRKRKIAEDAARKKAEEKAKEEEERRKAGMLRKPLGPVISPLLEEWDRKVDHVMGPNGLKTKIDTGGNITLTRTDLDRVLPGPNASAWLNDDIINAYLNSIVEAGQKDRRQRRSEAPKVAALSTFWYSKIVKDGPESTARWTRRAGINGAKLLGVERLFIPINLGNAHWTLCVVSPTSKSIDYYDSLGGSGRTVINNILKWLTVELPDEDFAAWRTDEHSQPAQSNMSDCGVFTITTSLMIMRGIDPTAYTADLIPIQRRRIVGEFLNGGLFDVSYFF